MSLPRKNHLKQKKVGYLLYCKRITETLKIQLKLKHRELNLFSYILSIVFVYIIKISNILLLTIRLLSKWDHSQKIFILYGDLFTANGLDGFHSFIILMKIYTKL